MPEKTDELLSLAAREWQAEWKAEGKAEGKVAALERILRRRLGDIPTATRERLAMADNGQLDAWIDRAVDTETLDAVFLEEPH